MSEKISILTLGNEIVFDNEKGIVTFLSGKDQTSSAVLLYQTLSGFEKAQHSTSTSSGTGKNSSTTTTYHFDLYLTKKDGGRIFLFTSLNKNDRDDWHGKLVNGTRLSTVANREIAFTLPQKYTVKNTLDGVQLAWENISSTTQLLFVGLFFTVFFGILAAIGYNFLSAGIDSIFPKLILVFIFLVGVLVIYFVLSTLVKDRNYTYELKITRTYLEYSEIHKKTGRTGKSNAISNAQLKHIFFRETIDENPFNTLKLKFQTKEEAEAEAYYKQNKGKRFLHFISGKLKQSLKLRITDQSTIDKINTEFWIQNKIKELSNLDID